MSVFAFASYEIHPTTPGGCGVLLANAAHQLLEDGHEVVFLLDLAEAAFRQFRDRDRLFLPHPERCRAYRVEELADTAPLGEGDFHDVFAWKSCLFERACRRLVELESPDVLEFFDYCGIAYAALSSKASGRAFGRTHLAVRLHTSIEVLDAEESTNVHAEDRYGLFALEHSALRMAETVLYPSERYLQEAYRPRYGPWWGRLAPSPPPLLRAPKIGPADADADAVLFFGRLFTLKGADLFVDAAVQLLERDCMPALRFIVAGYDPGTSPDPGLSYTKFLKRRVPARFRHRFEYPGQLSWDRLGDISSRVRFAVFPSRFESFCYAAHELAQAGVPIVVSDLPAFRDHFVDGETALFAGPGTRGLAAAMARMNEDDALRRRLAKAVPRRPAGLGAFYSEESRPSWMAGEGAAECPPRLLVVILSREASAVAATEASLARSLEEPDEVVVLAPALGADESDERSFPFLGASRRVERRVSGALGPPRTLDLLLVLGAGDQVEPEFLGTCRKVLRDHSRLGFVGAWKRLPGGEGYDTLSRDILGELPAFGAASPLGRCVSRTTPDVELGEIFDPRAGTLGEVQHLWRLETAGQPGVTVPELLLRLGPEPAPALDGRASSFLVVRDQDPARARRLARLSVVEAVRAPSGTLPAGAPEDSWKRKVVRALSRRGEAGRRLLGLLRGVARTLGRPS